MTSTNNPQSQERVPATTPSRPGIKFLLCLVGAVIAVTILVLRN
jgi:hypothetical protein